ncbi:MAG: EVE domain-containing protein [Candidatus Devosia symbiotica]|nr:EVE domain-containing protein [Candidatus Devosia symbiotica]
MASARYWIGLAARAHVMVEQTNGFVMVAHGSHSAVLRLQPGDWFVYYAPRQTFGGKKAVRRFVPIGQIANGKPMQRQMTVDVTGWFRATYYQATQEADIYPLLDQFGFVTERTHWSMYFRKLLFKVDIADFSLIAAAMGVGSQFNLGDN